MAKKKLDLEMLEALGSGAALEHKDDPSKKSVKHPGGRPRKTKKADRVFNINFYEEDFDVLSKNADLFGMPVATYIKYLIQQGGGFSSPQE